MSSESSVVAVSKDRRDQLVDDLLIALNDKIESEGDLINCAWFSFSEEADGELLDQLGISFTELTVLLDFCLSRRYLCHRTLGAGKYGNLALSEEGQGRAISADYARRNPRKTAPETGDIHIQTVNAHGATQIGHNNVQNVEGMFLQLIDKLEQADASEEQKNEAKGYLKAFLKHPLTNTILGPVASTVSRVLAGV